MNALAAATEAYQALLEGHRHDPDNEDLFEDLLKARAEMETAWLEHTAGVSVSATIQALGKGKRSND